LAEIAETLLSTTDVWDTQQDALHALRAIGDERSIAVLVANRPKVPATDVVDAFIRHIQRRVKA
jgi:HEAT repeat protein